MDNKGRTVEYVAWEHVIQRCTNPNDERWDDYGGRGITICERWRKSFKHFLEDVGLKSSPELSLDRIKNDGNYEPGNVRWATTEEQQANKRKQWNSSDYGPGVYYSERWGTFRVFLKRKGKLYTLGNFRNLEEAILARVEAEKHYEAGTLETFIAPNRLEGTCTPRRLKKL